MTTLPPPRASGIYRLIHRPSGEFYIGSTKNFYARYFCHKSNLRNRSRHPQAGVSRLWKRFRRFKCTDLGFEILEICTEDKLPIREIAWMNKLRPTLNTSRYASRVPDGIKYCVPADISKVPQDRKPGRKAKR